MAFPFMALANTLNTFGEQQRISAEGASSWNPYTGESYNPEKEKWSYRAAAVFAPHKILSDSDSTTLEKLGALTGTAGLFAGSRQERREKERMEALSRVKEVLGQTPAYESPEEVAQLQQVTSKGAESIRGISDEMIKVANAYQQKGMPGEEIRKQEINQYAKAAIDDYIETGGASSLDSIIETRHKQAQGLLYISEQATYRDYYATQVYLNTLMNTADMKAQAAQMEGMGLQAGISEASKLYQSKLEQTRPLQQFAIMQLGNQAAQIG